MYVCMYVCVCVCVLALSCICINLIEQNVSMQKSNLNFNENVHRRATYFKKIVFDYFSRQLSIFFIISFF